MYEEIYTCGVAAHSRITAGQVDYDETKDTGVKCHQIGLRKFSKQMVGLLKDR